MFFMKNLFSVLAVFALIGVAHADVVLVQNGKAQSAIYVAPAVMAADKPYGDSTPHVELSFHNRARGL